SIDHSILSPCIPPLTFSLHTSTHAAIMKSAVRYCIAAVLALSIGQMATASLVANDLGSKQMPMASPSDREDLKVPGKSPAYHCSDPSNDLYQIDHLNFFPTNPRL